MKYITKCFCGVDYLVPECFKFSHDTIGGYPSKCGAGEGIGDKVVPEVIGGKRCSHI